ncbi:DUF2730 family protein [Methylocystis heyeri]|uniref:DUF2730 family protein n=1 Tax=Methylocystis heyeri TaxID=391905 RepID=A0A6B8KGG9_9HYPH|nr:DUF2730 family protein [Methylocystis heyeri]QGM46722.1 DUF2730 family protein [Methylocystis heyeri]
MDVGTGAQWAAVATALGVAIWGAFYRRDQKAIDDLSGEFKEGRKDITRLFERVDGMESRLARVENEIEHLPTQKELHALATAVATLQATVTAKLDALIDNVKTISRQYQRAEERAIEAEQRAAAAEARAK